MHGCSYINTLAPQTFWALPKHHTPSTVPQLWDKMPKKNAYIAKARSPTGTVCRLLKNCNTVPPHGFMKAIVHSTRNPKTVLEYEGDITWPCTILHGEPLQSNQSKPRNQTLNPKGSEVRFVGGYFPKSK